MIRFSKPWFATIAVVAVMFCGCSRNSQPVMSQSAAQRPAPSPQRPPLAAQTVEMHLVRMTRAELYSDGISGWPVKDGQASFGLFGREVVFRLGNGQVRTDSNGDGVIDEKDPAVVKNAPDEAKFLTVPADTPFGRIDFPFFVASFQEPPSYPCLFYSPAMALEAKLGDHTIRLYSTGQGRDFSKSFTRMLVYEKAPEHPWLVPFSRTVAMDGRLYEIEVLEQGKRLSVWPVEGGIALVKLQIDGRALHGSAVLQSEDGRQVVAIRSGDAAICRPGRYRTSRAEISTLPRDQFGPQTESLSSAPTTLPAAIELKPGDNVLAFGSPYRLDFRAGYKQGTLTITEVTIIGQGGESYQVRGFIGDPREQEKQATRILVRLNGQEQDLGKVEYG